MDSHSLDKNGKPGTRKSDDRVCQGLDLGGEAGSSRGRCRPRGPQVVRLKPGRLSPAVTVARDGLLSGDQLVHDLPERNALAGEAQIDHEPGAGDHEAGIGGDHDPHGNLGLG